MSDEQSSVFHPGEQAVQEMTGMREHLAQIGKKLIRNYMPEQHQELFRKLPMILFGSLDAENQPWASVLTGTNGQSFTTTPDNTRLVFHTLPQSLDPLAANLQLGAPLGMLGMEPHTRRRNRMNGIVEAITGESFTLKVTQSFGNCPKYIQARSPDLRAQTAPPQLTRHEALTPALRQMIAAADTYFIASALVTPNERSVDVSHRGGKPGFIRIDDDNTLTAPDFLGNYFFNTLGNIHAYPKVGLLVIDFAGGSVLHLAATAEIIWDQDQTAQYPGAQRLLRFHIRQAVAISNAMPLTWSDAQYSPALPLDGGWR